MSSIGLDNSGATHYRTPCGTIFARYFETDRMTEHLDNRTHDLLFGIRRSFCYHNRRQRFYELWSSTTIFVKKLGVPSAAGIFLLDLPESWNWLPIEVLAIVVVFDAVGAAVRTERRANAHADLARQFIALGKRFAYNRNLEDREFAEVTNERLVIELSEPPSLVLLDVMCHFELLRVLGESREHPHIPWWRRFLANVMGQPGYIQQILAPRIL